MLLTQRDEIDTQLALLIGDEPQPQPSEKRTKRAPRQPKPVTKKGAKVCKKCGKPGHMAKTCTTSTVATPTFGDKALLTEDQFDELKHLQSIGDLISKDFAFDRDLALSEVNRAIMSRNYEAYSNS